MPQGVDRLGWYLEDLRPDAEVLRARLRDAAGLETTTLLDLLQIPTAPAPSRWLLVGEVSTGKSTLLNTLLERDYLPEGHHSTTILPTHILAPNEDFPDGTLVLEPYLPADHEAMLDWLIARLPGMTQSQASGRERAEAALNAEHSKPEQQPWLDALRLVLSRLDEPSDIATGQQVLTLGDPATDDLDDPTRWRRASLYLESKWSGSGVEWIDTPGLGHHEPLRRWMVERALIEADHILFLLEPRGATREAFDLLSGVDATVRARTVLLFSRIDELGDEDTSWTSNAHRMVEQLGWKGPWYGVSALCARYAREARRWRAESRQMRRFERVAMQAEPLSATDNIRLSGIDQLEHDCVLSAINATWQQAVGNHLQDLADALACCEQDLRRQRESRVRQLVGRKIEQQSVHLAAQDAAFAKQAATRLDAFIEAHEQAHQKIEHGVVAKTDRRQRQLFKALDEADQRSAALYELLRIANDELVSAWRTLWDALAHWMRRFFRPKGLCPPWVPPNLKRLQEAITSFDACWDGDFAQFQQSHGANASAAVRAAQRFGLRGSLRNDLADHMVERIHDTRSRTREYWLTLYEQSGGGKRETPLTRTLAQWQRISLDAYRKQGTSLLDRTAERLRAHDAALSSIRTLADDLLANDEGNEALLIAVIALRGKLSRYRPPE